MDSDPLAELNREERRALVELARKRNDSKLSRRDALAAAGLLGGGALLGGGGAKVATQQASAQADTSDGVGDVGLPNDRVDVFADGVDANQVTTEDVKISPRQPNVWDDGSRSITTTEDTTLYVSPTGNADAEGTENDPITWDEAAKRTPYFLNHDWRIILKAGSYGAARFPPIITVSKPNNTSAFRIETESGLNPEDVEISDTLELSLISGEVDDAMIRDVTIRGSLIQKIGGIKVVNCTFTADDGPQDISGSTLAYNAHAPTLAEFDDCHFAESVDIAFLIERSAKVGLYSCSGNPSEYVAEVKRGSELIEEATGNLWGKQGWVKSSLSGKWVDSNGEVRAGNGPVLYDDFGDGRIQNRLRPPTGGYRPEWDENTGSPSAVDGAASLPAGDATSQGMRTPYLFAKVISGTWEMKVQAQSTPSTGRFDLRLFRGPDGYWAVRLEDNGSVQLLKTIGGTSTDLITGTWPADTNEHTVKVTRAEGGEWEVSINGSSLGTHTDDSVTLPERVELLNSFDAEVQVPDFSIQS